MCGEDCPDTEEVASEIEELLAACPQRAQDGHDEGALAASHGCRSLVSTEGGPVTDPLDTSSKLVMRDQFWSPTPQHQ